MSKEINGMWGIFRRKVSPAGGLFINLSTRQVALLKDVQEQKLDYSDIHVLEIIGSLSRMGLVHHQKGSPHQITEPGLKLLGLLGVNAMQPASLERAG
jgi:uncharacterized protein YjhX (UPF0386 family)